MTQISSLATELDKLKSVYRTSYISDGSRNESSAEHSWHLAITLMGFARHIPGSVDLNRAIRMALVHDVCEIGAGDVCAYHADSKKHANELAYLNQFAGRFPDIGSETKQLWAEYEAGKTAESKWVKLVDKLLPFVLNIQNRGKTWKEQRITRSMVVHHNAFVADLSSEIHDWMLNQISVAVQEGWLDPA